MRIVDACDRGRAGRCSGAATALRVDLSMRVIYLLVVALMTFIYWHAFGSRFS